MNNESISKVAIQLTSISKTFHLNINRSDSIRTMFFNVFKRQNKNKLKALTDINLKIDIGETFGIIGRNGSGKSTLLNIIMDSIRPDKGGSVNTIGKIMRLSLGIGVDPNLSARDNIYVNGSLLGLTFKKIGNIFDSILEFAGIKEFVDTPVKFFSKGMRQRLLFSIAMHAESDIFLLDEFFGGTGDKDFKKKSDKAFQDKIIEGKTIIIVSHNLNTIKKYCSRVMWIDKGVCKAIGDPKVIITKYKESFN